MKQQPSKLNYKKYQKANYSYINLYEKKNFFSYFGFFGLQCLNPGKLNFRQIEACRRTIRRGIPKKDGLLFIRIFTSIPLSNKPLASRMGKGKGSISSWVSLIKKGQIILEIGGVSWLRALYVLHKCRKQIPFRVKIVKLLY